MRRLLWLLCLVSFVVPSWALAATIYVRPGHDGNGNTLTYGAGTGADAANAIAGFATIASGAKVLAPDDIVCLPGSTEPFFEQFDYPAARVDGTAEHPITIKGCDAVVSGDSKTSTNKALIWSGFEITGNRSINAARAAVTGAAYAWATVATDIYKKRVDYRPRVLWEDSTWLTPFRTGTGTDLSGIDALSEATILATLPVGYWGNKNNGDGTFTLYYHATGPTKRPTTTTMRIHSIPLETAYLVGNNNNYITFQDIEIRGHNPGGASPHNFITGNASNVTLTRVISTHGKFNFTFSGPGADIADIVLTHTQSLNAEGVGFAIRGGVGRRFDRLTIDGGKYNYTNGLYYNGTVFEGSDGDGIGLGFEGGTWSDFVIKNAEINGNYNYAVFYGTSNAMKLTNLTLKSLVMSQNRRGCFSEGVNDWVRGMLLISGVVCSRSFDQTGLPNYGDAWSWNGGGTGIDPQFGFNLGSPVVRDIILENVTLTGNRTQQTLRLLDDANNHYHVQNVLIYNNLGGGKGTYIGDFPTFGPAAPGFSKFDANDTFDHIYWAPGTPGAHTLLSFQNYPVARSYYYDVPQDVADFTTLLNCTNCVFNVDPSLVSTTDFRLQLGTRSPTKAAGPPKRAITTVPTMRHGRPSQ